MTRQKVMNVMSAIKRKLSEKDWEEFEILCLLKGEHRITIIVGLIKEYMTRPENKKKLKLIREAKL